MNLKQQQQEDEEKLGNALIPTPRQQHKMMFVRSILAAAVAAAAMYCGTPLAFGCQPPRPRAPGKIARDRVNKMQTRLKLVEKGKMLRRCASLLSFHSRSDQALASLCDCQCQQCKPPLESFLFHWLIGCQLQVLPPTLAGGSTVEFLLYRQAFKKL